MIPIFPPSIIRLFLLPITLMVLVGGCRSVQLSPHIAGRSLPTLTSHSSSPRAETASRWPSRWGNDPDRRGTIIELDPAAPLRPIHLSRFHQFRSTDIEYSDANQLAADIGITTGFKFQAEGPGSFLFIPNPKNESTPDLTKDTGKLAGSKVPDLAFKFVSATKITEPEPIKSKGTIVQEDSASGDSQTQSQVTLTMTPAKQGDKVTPKLDPNQDYVEIQRTWFTYKDPKQSEAIPEPVGTILILPGMFGTPDPIVDALENYWHHKGYAILRMRSQPSRFTEHYEFNTQPGKAVLLARPVADMNDDRVAEGAYATKAALDHLLVQRPSLNDKPVILVGMSGGAMMLPTIYAYAPDQYNAAVLIAGGANFLKISIESNYKSWIDAITFDWDPHPDKTGEITGEHLDNFSQVYLRKSRLDAYHTATEMTDIPVLMLHASADKAVPSSAGELLYQQLGQPERWSYPIGHELIFLGLPTQVDRINNWITKHVLEEQAQ